MKTYMEMANEVFRRAEVYKAAKQKQRTMLVRTGTAIGGAGLIALVGVGVWRQQAGSTPPPLSVEDSLVLGEPDTIHETESTTTDTTATTTLPTTAPSPSATTTTSQHTTGTSTLSSSTATTSTTAVSDVPDDGKELFAINKITNTVGGAARYLDPALHYREQWDAAKMMTYVGVDLRTVAEELPEPLTYSSLDTFTVTFKNDGTLVEDRCAVQFDGANGELVTIMASRVGVPYDCLYMLETEETTPLRLRSSGEIIDVLVGAAMVDQELYVADFAYDGVNYRIKVENAPPVWIDQLIRAIAE